jgi:iron complex outermembrane receptor protein
MRRAASGILAGLFISVSFAQDDAILVEATRFPEQVRRLPASVTVLAEEDIARSAARTLPELLAGEAGITMKDFFGNNAASTSIDLRGYGITGAQNTLILLDGRRLNDFDLSGVQWSAIPLSAIERVEILRGSGAVLYGDGASAGVINIVTRSPLRQGNALEALGRVGSFGAVEGQLYAGAAAGEFGVNGSLYRYDADGYRANNRNEQRNAALNLRWAVGQGALDLRFGSDRQDLRLPGGRRTQPSAGLNQYVLDPRGARTPLDYASRDGLRAGLSFLQRIGEAEVSAGLDHRSKDQRSFFNQDGFPVYRADGLELTAFTPRLRIPFATGGLQHRLVVGADWNSWRFRSRRTNLPENLARPTNRVGVDQRTEGIYAQDAIEVVPGTTVSAGWRAERARYRGADAADSTAPGCAFPPCPAAAPLAATQTERAWELGLRHALGPRWSVFVRRGRSFRLVNAEEFYDFDALGNPQFQLLRPQHALTSEAGAEWRVSGHALRATLFRSDVTDEIHLDPFTAGVGNTNLPPSRRRGIELDGRWQATRALQLSGAYAYTEAEFLQGTLAGGPFAIGTNLPLAGKTVPLVPRHKLNLGFAWDIAERTRLSGALTGVSSQVFDNDEPNNLGRRIPAYSVLDLKLARSAAWGRLSVALNNVLDERYYTYAVRSQFTADRYDVYPLPGRALYLTAELFLP